MPKISALPPMTTADAADEQPIVDTSVSTTKKWSLTLLKTYLQSLVGWISTAMLADNAVTAAKLGTDLWGWEKLYDSGELGSPADSISSGTIAARKNLRVIMFLMPSGNITSNLRFNNDSGSNYAFNRVTGDSVSQTSVGTGNSNLDQYSVIDIYNRSATEKLINWYTTFGSASAAAAPIWDRVTGKWHNTSAQITRVDAINGGSGDFAAGSRLIVLGKD